MSLLRCSENLHTYNTSLHFIPLPYSTGYYNMYRDLILYHLFGCLTVQ